MWGNAFKHTHNSFCDILQTLLEGTTCGMIITKIFKVENILQVWCGFGNPRKIQLLPQICQPQKLSSYRLAHDFLLLEKIQLGFLLKNSEI